VLISGGKSIADCIVDHASDLEADILVIGQKGHGWSYGLQGQDGSVAANKMAKLGSISSAVSRHAQCAVLIRAANPGAPREAARPPWSDDSSGFLPACHCVRTRSDASYPPWLSGNYHPRC
jgi:hypothetical protein